MPLVLNDSDRYNAAQKQTRAPGSPHQYTHTHPPRTRTAWRAGDMAGEILAQCSVGWLVTGLGVREKGEGYTMQVRHIVVLEAGSTRYKHLSKALRLLHRVPRGKGESAIVA